MDRIALSTRDAQLPAAYSDRLEALSLAPLWTALHALLPPERQTRVVPHRWRWSELRAPLLEAARLVPIEQAERRVLVLCNPGPARQLLGDRDALRGPADHPARRGGAQSPSHRGRAAPDRRGRRGLHHGGRREVRDGAGRFHHHPADALARPRPRGPRAGDLAGRARHSAGAQRRGELGLGDEARVHARRPRPTPPRTSSPRPASCRASRATRRPATRRCAGRGAPRAPRSRRWPPPRPGARRWCCAT